MANLAVVFNVPDVRLPLGTVTALQYDEFFSIVTKTAFKLHLENLQAEHAAEVFEWLKKLYPVKAEEPPYVRDAAQQGMVYIDNF